MDHSEVTPPRVSVVLAVDRSDPYLRQAVDSILEQSYSNFELLIIVNRKILSLLDEIKEIYKDEARIRLLETPALGGLAYALNLGIGEAQGEYIARMDCDDISLPDRFEHQVAYLDAHPRVAVVGGRLNLIDGQSKPLNINYPYYGTDREIRKILPIRNPMPHPALMMRKSVLYKVGGYKYGNSSEDYELFLRMSRDPDIEFANLDHVVLQYRRHCAQITNPCYYNRRFSDMAGYQVTEFLRSYHWKHLLGICVIHPWARKLRSLLTQNH